MKCYLCRSNNIVRRNGSVRNAPHALINECVDCGLVFLEDAPLPNYAEGDMETSSAWLSESERDDARRFDALKGRIEYARLLDVGCGAGGFLAKASQCADAIGVEPDRRVHDYFKAQGLRVVKTLDEISGVFDIITLFHVLEHFQDPRAILKRLKSMLAEGGVIVVEVPNADDALLSLYESAAFSNFVYWTCHRYLFNAGTMLELAYQAGLIVQSLEHVQRYPLSNHLHWLAKGEKDGHLKWKFLDSQELSAAYEHTLKRIGKTDTIMAYLCA